MFWKGWDPRNQQMFQSRIIKIRDCNPNMLFDISNHIKYQKVAKTCPEWDAQNISKIIKNPPWDTQGPSWTHPCTKWPPNWYRSGPPRLQNTSKMVSQDASKSMNVYALLHETHGKWFPWLNANNRIYPETMEGSIVSMISILQNWQTVKAKGGCNPARNQLWMCLNVNLPGDQSASGRKGGNS